MRKSQVIVSGSIAIDRLMNFNGRYKDLIQANKLQSLSLAVLIDGLQIAPGGTGANICYGLAALGESPILLGSIGHDGTEYVERLAAIGVDTSHLHVSDLSSGSFSVFTDSDGAQMGGFYPGAMSDSALLSFEPWKGKDILAVVAAHDPAAMIRQVEECHRYNLRLVYDPGQQVTILPAEDLRTGLKAAEVVFVNEYELGLLAKKLNKSAEEIQDSVPIFVTTLGKNGSRISGKKIAKPINIKIAKPEKIVDPTGAGDAYRAGFLYGYLREWDVKTSAQLGSVTSSYAVEAAGPQVKLQPALIEQRYQKNFKQRAKL